MIQHGTSGLRATVTEPVIELVNPHTLENMRRFWVCCRQTFPYRVMEGWHVIRLQTERQSPFAGFTIEFVLTNGHR